MDSTAGDLNHATKELDLNAEKFYNHDSTEGEQSNNRIPDTKGYSYPRSSGSSSTELKSLDKLDSHVIKIDGIKDTNDAYAHLPATERDIIKRQLETPKVKISFKSLFRYATGIDITIIVISCICAIAGGAVLPLMTVSIALEDSAYDTLKITRFSLVSSQAPSKDFSTAPTPIRISILNYPTSLSTLFT